MNSPSSIVIRNSRLEPAARCVAMSPQILRTTIVLGAAVLLSACSTAPATSAGASPRTVGLTMTDQMTFEPARIEVRRGETIRFVVRNVSNESHEVYIGTDEEQRLHATEHGTLPGSAQSGINHFGYGVHVPPYGTGELMFKFDPPYEFLIGCHYPGHYEAGQRAIIEVTE